MRALRLALARCLVRTVIPAMFGRANPVMARLLRSPLHPLLSSRILVLRFEGRRTGRAYRVPVTCYPADGGALNVLTSADVLWWRNLDGGAPASALYRGREREARVEIVRGVDAPAEVERALASRNLVSRALVPLPASESVLLRVWLS